jgi:hypothetical protein
MRRPGVRSSPPGRPAPIYGDAKKAATLPSASSADADRETTESRASNESQASTGGSSRRLEAGVQLDVSSPPLVAIARPGLIAISVPAIDGKRQAMRS